MDEITKTVTVTNEKPEADFSYSPKNPVPDEEITFDGSLSSDSDGEIVEYRWEVENDYAGDDQTIDYSFSTAGDYEVTLKVFDNGEKMDEITKTVTVTNEKPVTRFDYTVAEESALRVSFDGTNSVDPDGEIVQYEWYVDDDYAGSGPRTTIDFSRKGSYEIRLITYDNGEKQNSSSRTIGVSRAPTASISLSQSPIALDQSVELTAANAVDPDGTIESIVWTFSDGTTKQGETVSRVFQSTGTQTIELTLTDDTGNVQVITRSVSVRKPPEVSFSWSPESPEDDATIEFTANSPDNIRSYKWKFSEDNEITESGRTVEHSYPDGGDKKVTLYAEGTNGVTSRLSQSIEVRQVPPAATFSWSPETPRDGQDIVFNATSPDDIETFEWDFNNDGTTENEGKTVTHTFTSEGKRTVVLRVEESTGDTATYREVVTVQRSASFDLTTSQSTSTVREEITVQFTTSNNVRDREVDVKLRLSLPESGISITGVNGGNLVSRQSTDFITIEPGGSRTLRIRMQANDPDNYAIGGTAIYYFGGEESGDRRETVVSPINVTVNAAADSSTDDSGPGFGILPALIAVSLFFASRKLLMRK